MQTASRQCLWRDTSSPNGTILAVELSGSNLTLRITGGALADDSDAVTVDWGDGTRSVYGGTGLSGASHTYASAGEFAVRISDDIASLCYAGSLSQVEKDMLRELVCLGSKVKSILGYSFNNCHRMRGVINLPNVISIGGYAFGTTLGITDYILPSMKTLVQESFYAGSTATRMYADNATQIGSRFWEFYGKVNDEVVLRDMYLRNSTCARIKAMSGFPFKAPAFVRFHGSDGVVMGDGTIIAN